MMSYQKIYLLIFGILAWNFCHSVSPISIPEHLLADFTMNGNVPVTYSYSNDSYSSDQPLIYMTEQIENYITMAQHKQTQYYGATDLYLYEALEKHLDQISGKNVAVMGSNIPWYESILLNYGAFPTTIEYNRIISSDKRLKLMTVNEYENNPQLFDAVLSISSFEHDGLGRYGDKINPNGDLEAMEKVKKMLHPEGLLFLAVPVGQDLLVWNLHRVYGKIRLKALLNGWEVIGSFGYTPDDLDCIFYGHQPVFVLKPKKGS